MIKISEHKRSTRVNLVGTIVHELKDKLLRKQR